MNYKAKVRGPSYCHLRVVNIKSFGAKRRLRLLHEFLQRRYARLETNVQEETVSKHLHIEVQEVQVTLLDDLLFMIFVLLPAESLFRLQFVCKKWFRLINASVFITSHCHHSETVLFCKKLTLLEPVPEDKPRSYFHFLDLVNGENNFFESKAAELFEIQASYNGLILAITENRKSLILMNPVTRKQIAFPLSKENDCFFESFGIVFCYETKTYVVVRLFCKTLLSISCEILHVSTRKWTRIEGPPSELLVDIRQMPTSVGGSLYWMSSKQGCAYFVSMSVHDEKFTLKKLPVNNCLKYRLTEMGGNLGCFSYSEVDLLQVWVLVADGGLAEDWVKRHSIDLSVCVAFPSPICCWKNGKGVVLEMKNELYVYEFQRGEMKLIQSTSDEDVWFGRIYDEYIPHRNTLASWEDHLQDCL